MPSISSADVSPANCLKEVSLLDTRCRSCTECATSGITGINFAGRDRSAGHWITQCSDFYSMYNTIKTQHRVPELGCGIRLGIRW